MMPTERITPTKNFLITQWKRVPILISACTLLLASNASSAEEAAKGEKFRIAIGGYTIPQYDSSISLTDADLGGGVAVDPQDTLGVTYDETVLRLDGRYRFNEANSLTFSWYSIAADGSRVLDQDFEWADPDGNAITIPAGASVTTSLDYDIYKVGYLWSFYHSDKVELGIGAGLHVTKIGVGLNASDSSQGQIDTKSVSTTVPLPVLSFDINYQVTPKLRWYIKSEIFALAYDEWEGNYTDNTFGLEYRFWKHIGLGTGLGANSLKLTQTTSEYKFAFDNRITGILFYVVGYY